MIVAVDLDEVVFNFVDPYFQFLSEKYGRLITRSQLTSDWSAERSGLVPKDSSKDNLSEFLQLGGFHNLDFMPGAEEGLFDLANCHSIIFVTSRESEARYDTVATLEIIGYSHIPLYFSTQQTTKGMILQNIGAHYLIDDNPEFINEARHRFKNCVSILMSQIPASIMAVGGEDIVSGWDELRKKRPELFENRRV